MPEEIEFQGSLTGVVLKNSAYTFLTSIVSKIGALVFTIILARLLNPEGFGIYSLAMSICLIFLTFADIGINQTMIRYVSSEIEKNKKLAAAYFQYILKMKILFSFILAALLLLSAYPLSVYIFKKIELFTPLIILSFYLFILSLENFFESLFYIQNKVKYIFIKEIILQISRISLVALLFYFIIKSYYIVGITVSLLITILIVFFIVLYFNRKNYAFLFKRSNIKIDKKRVLHFIFYLIMGGISGIFFSYIDTVLLGIFLSAEYVGYYRAAFTLVFGIAGLLSFINVFLPVLTMIEKERLSNAFNKIVYYSMMLAIPSTVGLLFLSRYILKFVYSEAYLPASLPLYFLAPLIILAVGIGNLQVLFSAREKPKKFVKLTIVITILNIILNYILITSLIHYSNIWATAGASIATLVSYIFYFLYAFRIAKKELDIDVNWKFMIKPLFSSFIMYIALLGISLSIRDMTPFLGFLEVLAGVIVYLGVMVLIKGIKKEDINLIKLIK